MKSRGEHAIPTSQFRLLKASTLVLAILLVIPGVETVVDTVGSSAARSTDATGIDSTVLVGGADALASLERVEKAAIAEETTVSDAFHDASSVAMAGGTRQFGWVRSWLCSLR